MPANLSPEYKKAEQAFREAADDRQRLLRLREMLRTIPKHKGTEHLQADIKSRIKQLTQELAAPKKGAARTGPVHTLRPEGAAQVALLGPPNAGKSSLHARLTGSRTDIGPYPFTTREPLPGMLPYRDVHFQLVDLPPISADYMESWLVNTLQPADAALLVADISVPECIDQFETVLRRLDEKRISLIEDWPGLDCGAGAGLDGATGVVRAAPSVASRGTASAGRTAAAAAYPVGSDAAPSVASRGMTDAAPGAARAARAAAASPARHSVAPAAKSVGKPTAASDPELDPFRIRLPTLLVVNKMDLASGPEEADVLLELLGARYPAVAASTVTGQGLEAIGALLFQGLEVVRVYTKSPGKPPEMDRPFTVRRGATVLDVARLVHKDIAGSLKYARAWGKGVFDGQQIGPEHRLADADVVELHMR